VERDKEEYSFSHQDGKRPRKEPLFGGARPTIEPGSDFPIGVRNRPDPAKPPRPREATIVPDSAKPPWIERRAE